MLRFRKKTTGSEDDPSENGNDERNVDTTTVDPKERKFHRRSFDRKKIIWNALVSISIVLLIGMVGSPSGSDGDSIHGTRDRLPFLRSKYQHRPSSSLPSKSSSSSKNTSYAETNERPILHIIKSRFMQNQGNLTALASARIHLFRTFCLPTLIHQTTSNFLWIIKTDPDLTPSIRNELTSLLRPHPHFYLVGTNEDFGYWRGGIEGERTVRLADDGGDGGVYTGDVDLLRSAAKDAVTVDGKIVLETRLDMDDGLRLDYIESLQEVALVKFGRAEKSSKGYKVHDSSTKTPPSWFYWCVSNTIDWFSLDTTGDGGSLAIVRNKSFCITPGLTVGFDAAVSPDDVLRIPKVGHHKLYRALRSSGECGDEKCIEFVNPKLISAVRARSPTSAGMKDVVREERMVLEGGVEEKAFGTLQSDQFGLSLEDIRETQAYLYDNMYEIAKENLEGQCTKGHSCKESSKIKLKALMELYKKEN